MDFLPSFSFLKPHVAWGKLVLKMQRERLAAEVRSNSLWQGCAGCPQGGLLGEETWGWDLLQEGMSSKGEQHFLLEPHPTPL